MSRPLRTHWWAWAVLAVAAVALLVVAARPTPTSGTSDDRLFSLAAQMKCLACAGESVANSGAPLAVEMRGQIEQQMRAGSSDDEILTFFADRYGARVLLTPSASGLGALIWVVPVVVAAVSICALGLAFARWRRLAEEAPTPSDEDRELVERARRDA
jgi:cytochrome c-type biogenesis protein CcmH